MSVMGRNSLNFDAVVVGSGPAGSMAALSLARRGVRTLLVDRALHPRPKVCGCCIAPQGQHVLRRAGLDEALRGARPLTRLHLHWRGRRAIVRKTGYVAMAREDLDARLAGAAQAAGAQALWQTSASVSDDGTVTLRAHDQEHIVRGAVVICADGLHGGSLAHHTAFSWRISKCSRMGVGATLPANACDIPAEEVRMMIVDGGYVGLVRLPDGRVDVAAAILPARLRAAGGPAACLRPALLEAGCTSSSIADAAWTGTAQLTRSRWPLAKGRVLVTGDAAAYVEPITGEGISWAISTGSAAGALGARIAAGQADAREWPRLHAHATRHPRWRCAAVAGLLRVPALVSGALSVAHRLPHAAASLVRPFGAGAST